MFEMNLRRLASVCFASETEVAWMSTNPQRMALRRDVYGRRAGELYIWNCKPRLFVSYGRLITPLVACR